MIDTHCHLDLPAFDPDRLEVLERSRRAGVGQWVVPGIRLGDFPRLAALRGSAIHLALGLHPMFTGDHPDDGLGQLADWLDRLQPVAVGEIGLDYLVDPTTFDRQRVLFQGQLALARQRGLPVLLHVRKAHDETIALLRRCASPAAGIVHAFNGSLQQAQHYLALGFKLGFGGVVTHPQARRIRTVAAALAATALVLESDAPDLPPDGHQGQRNEPALLPLVVATLAQLRHCTTDEIIAATDQNAMAVLGLKGMPS